MDLDMMAHPLPLAEMRDLASSVEATGLDGLWLTESGRTAYLGCGAAALSTERIAIGTGVAVAFPRSPMVTAKIAWELAEASGGRFILGLGTQVKAHVERRYSSAFGPPGPRMREYVLALRAIFRAFRGEEKLSFDGDHYRFSLLPAAWSPGSIDVADPPVFVSAVLPWMSRMAGEVCDGVIIHPFHSIDYVRDVQLPEIERGAVGAGRSLEDITFEIPLMTAVGDTDEEISITREHARSMVAFYGSTPNYAPVFDHHGFEGMTTRLGEYQRAGDIAAMTALITDEVLDHYIVTSTWDGLAEALQARYASLAPNVRLMSYTAITQWRRDPEVLVRWGQVAQELHARVTA